MRILPLIILLFISIQIKAQEINWLTIEQAEKAQKENPNKPMFIDIYTDWCGWCAKLDAKTFKDTNVVKHISENYIPVKLDAEHKDIINFRGQDFKFIKSGRSGINLLAYHLLQGKTAFPSMVILSSDGKILNTLNGYFTPEQLLQQL
ncbi:Thiol:disulfide interchange protein [Candidatus Ornithobacterium hominis]|uniref:thioredoxin family protein n=1 Tax=Candidatus Ornithobacterium hominis TaxID=2497989 RepID=UPI0024BCF5E5|nr:DUF255 domain-containing protein [Candidatus Ornithobacterium hominis]CAI9428668.1 Thiol:disulfide interchange protein [Candidatus Ornithobacterium hominis]